MLKPIMKLSLTLRLTTIATITLTTLLPLQTVKAQGFDEKLLDQSQVIAIARPLGGGAKYDLLVIEQIAGKRQCWNESGSNPALIEPLLLNFDFTGICRRSTDSNGYSMRVDGQDYGLDYLLRLVIRDGDVVLVATSRTHPGQKDIVVGRTGGISQGFMKIVLDPGWQFTKRTFKGRELGHFYFSGQGVAIRNTTTSPSPSLNATPDALTPATPDISTPPVTPDALTPTTPDSPAPVAPVAPDISTPPVTPDALTPTTPDNSAPVAPDSSTSPIKLSPRVDKRSLKVFD